jgi:hypothetical protein
MPDPRGAGRLDKVLVAPQAAPVAGGRPGARGQSRGSGRRARADSRRGTAAQGEQNPGAMAGPRRRAQDLLKPVQNHRIDLADALARRAELGRELDDPPSEVRGLIERHEQLRELEDEDPVENAEDFYPRTCRAAWRPTWSGRSSRANRRSVWRSNTAGGRGEEMATQEQKIVQALGGGAGSTHLMCPHCGKRVDLTYRSSYELVLDLAVREPRPDEEVRPGDKG